MIAYQLPHANTKAGLRREVLRLAIDGGVSSFVLESRLPLAYAMTDMLLSGEIIGTSAKYPWVGFTTPQEGGKENGNV